MTRFRYDCSRPLSLVQRRTIAARLCHLVGTAIGPDETPPADWYLFVRGFGALLESVGTRGETGLEMVQTVDQIRATYGNGRYSELVHRSVERIEVLKKAAFACELCGHHNGGCIGDPLDARFFEDEGDDDERPGGLCIGFVRKLAREALTSAEALYLPLADNTVKERLPKEIVLKLERCGENRDATLPIDGRVDIENGEVVITISWPEKCEEIEQGIAMLPWLIYHEIFVHVFQGLGRERPIGRVQANCVFTEGAVDAAARAMLSPHLLDTALPAEIAPLRTHFDAATENYGKGRYKPREEDYKPGTRESKAAQFRRARSRGAVIFDAIKGLATRRNKPANWPAYVLMRLNLDLSLDQRAAFARDFWELLDPSGKRLLDQAVEDELSIWFEMYLSGGSSAENLLDELPQIADSRFSHP